MFGDDERATKTPRELPRDPTTRISYVGMNDVHSAIHLLGLDEIRMMTAEHTTCVASGEPWGPLDDRTLDFNDAGCERLNILSTRKPKATKSSYGDHRTSRVE